MSEKPNIASLFNRSGNLTLSAMERYLKGELTDEERNVVETHLAESPFEQEALEGIRNSMTENLEEDVKSLNNLVTQSALARAAAPRKRLTRRYYLAAAASLAVIASLIVVLVLMFQDQAEKPQLALSKADSAYSQQEAVTEEIPPVTSQAFPDEDKQVETEVQASGTQKPAGAEEKIPDHDQPPDPSQPVKITIVEDDIAIDENVLIAEEQPSPMEILGGVNADDANVSAGRPGIAVKKETKASYTVQADQLRQLEEMEEMVADSQIFMVVETMPEFPGGDDSLHNYVMKNLEYPASAVQSSVQGRVFVTFVIEEDGSVTNVRILRGIGGGCDEEAVRVVSMMPKWIPGKQRGQPVRVQFNLPIKFTLQGK
jgi:protein TonB